MIDVTWIVVQALFGALGAVSRFGVMTVVKPGRWAWGLFVVNIGGSLGVGVAVGAFSVGAIHWPVAAVVLAFAAGFTTFSTLTLTAAEWANRNELRRALLLAAKHVVVGVMAAGAGYISAAALFAA